jgi:hypothetical protein
MSNVQSVPVEILDSSVLEDDEPERVRRLEIPFVQRAAIESSLRLRGRFSPELRSLGCGTLERLDAMFEQLAKITSNDEAMRCVHDAFDSERERRAALVPMLALLYPHGFFDEKTPTTEIVRLVARSARAS